MSDLEQSEFCAVFNNTVNALRYAVIAIPRAQHEALMALQKASAALEAVVRNDANPSGWFKAMAEMFKKLAALRATGILEGDRPND